MLCEARFAHELERICRATTASGSGRCVQPTHTSVARASLSAWSARHARRVSDGGGLGIEAVFHLLQR